MLKETHQHLKLASNSSTQLGLQQTHIGTHQRLKQAGNSYNLACSKRTWELINVSNWLATVQLGLQLTHMDSHKCLKIGLQ